MATLADLFTSIANAIRAKGGTSAAMYPNQMPQAIADIQPQLSLQTKTKSYTPSETAQSEAVTADANYDGLQQVNVAVGAIPSDYIGSDVTQRSGSDLTASGRTVTVPQGYYGAQATKSVQQGTAGTPSASKGAVSNHAVTVTPSVTNSEGYISGGTKTGTGVTVTASELVSGSETKTQNGTYDVTNLAQLVVNVSGGGGSGLVYETGEYKPTSDASRPTVSFANSHSETPFFVAMFDSSAASGITANSNTVFVFFDMYRLAGGGYPYSNTATRYALALCLYRSSSSSTFASTQVSYNSDNTSDSSTSYSRYWVTASNFKPYSNSSSRYWRANRVYKWIAVWKPTT